MQEPGSFQPTPVNPSRRIGAATLDWTICIAAYLVVSIPLGAVQALGFELRADAPTRTLGLIVNVLVQIAVAVPSVFYFTVGLRAGQTVGMEALDFKTLDARTGKPPGTLRAALRALLSVVLAVGVYTAYMGHSAERDRLSPGLVTVYLLSVAVAAFVILDKTFIFVPKSRRTLTDRLFGLVRVTGVPRGDDRGLSVWLDARAKRW